ncbi:ion channel [Cognatishimia activa]|uniref:Ion channel n=1 Tax=Cognatishimia activa TaxID=1715691 RepID=A0A0P1J0H9_9RHOB|nr:ion channel [Cognatishimia activa]MEE2945685.1 ion channel [Pseudomonadota bacterium]CUI77514.1 Ion channel [Cognatishimia activa]CUK26781.1 Ion channel [Cognatishimia activa]
MFSQLLIGSIITFVSLLGASVVWWWMNEILFMLEPALRAPYGRHKSALVFFLAVVSAMVIMGFGVSLWAVVFAQMSVFASWEEAVYYSLVAYSTLGLGDVTLPQDQRLLGGMTGANGFLMFGLVTAMLTDSLRQIGRMQRTSNRMSDDQIT